MFNTSLRRCVNCLKSETENGPAQCVIDHNGKAPGYRSVVYHGRSSGFHGSDAWISRRKCGSCSSTPVIKAERVDELEWRMVK